ncbi:MAG TPA: hypothetical protein VIT23_05085, partial [Terrimicrobiaceae bacterium]
MDLSCRSDPILAPLHRFSGPTDRATTGGPHAHAQFSAKSNPDVPTFPFGSLDPFYAALTLSTILVVLHNGLSPVPS